MAIVTQKIAIVRVTRNRELVLQFAMPGSYDIQKFKTLVVVEWPDKSVQPVDFNIIPQDTNKYRIEIVNRDPDKPYDGIRYYVDIEMIDFSYIKDPTRKTTAHIFS